MLFLNPFDADAARKVISDIRNSIQKGLAAAVVELLRAGKKLLSVEDLFEGVENGHAGAAFSDDISEEDVEDEQEGGKQRGPWEDLFLHKDKRHDVWDEAV